MPVLYGLFLYMGVSALKGLQVQSVNTYHRRLILSLQNKLFSWENKVDTDRIYDIYDHLPCSFAVESSSSSIALPLLLKSSLRACLHDRRCLGGDRVSLGTRVEKISASHAN